MRFKNKAPCQVDVRRYNINSIIPSGKGAYPVKTKNKKNT